MVNVSGKGGRVYFCWRRNNCPSPKKNRLMQVVGFFLLFVLEVWLQPIINRCLCAIWLPFKAVLKNEPGLSGFGWVIIALIQCVLLVVHVSLWYAFHTLFREEISLPCCSEEERLPLISMALPHPLIKQHYRKIFSWQFYHCVEMCGHDLMLCCVITICGWQQRELVWSHSAINRDPSLPDS